MERNEEREGDDGRERRWRRCNRSEGLGVCFFVNEKGENLRGDRRWVVRTFQAPPAARFPSELELVHFLMPVIGSLTPALLLSNNHHDKKGWAQCEHLVPCSRVAWQRSDGVLALMPPSKFFCLEQLLSSVPWRLSYHCHNIRRTTTKTTITIII